MSGGAIALIVIAAIVVIIVLWLILTAIGTYNGLVQMNEGANNAFSDISVQYQRRYDLIPNLVVSCKVYMAHESETLTGVIEARNQSLGALKALSSNPGDAEALMSFKGAESALGGMMGRLMAVSESYPELKANQNISQLMMELGETEDAISMHRESFNNSVTQFNIFRQRFPQVFFASMFGFSKNRELLEFDTEAISKAPSVGKLFDS